MPTITTKDGTEIFYKDWGPRDAQPIMFHHGWPLSADDWDAQMMFFLGKGYRVIAHDRRGHGRSTQTATGNDMDTYVADVTALTDALDLRDAIHVGHSTGGGEVARYVARAKPGRVAKAVLISAVAPIMVQSATNPNGVPVAVFDEVRQQTATNRAQFFIDFTLPFYGYNRDGAEVKEGVRRNWWRQGMMGSVLAHHDGIAAFSETDFTEDLKRIAVPTLVMHGEDDQVVPFANAGALSAKLVPGAVLKSYPGYPHGMPTTHADADQRGSPGFHRSLSKHAWGTRAPRPNRTENRTMGHNILIFYGSYRSDRQGIRLADYLVGAFTARGAQPELIDAKVLELPMLDRMYKEYAQGTAPPALEALARKIRAADAFVFVTGEYNWGVQPGLKNLTDHFLEEWFWRPAAIASYSAGRFSGVRAGLAWHGILSEMGMVVVSSALAVGTISQALSPAAEPTGEGGAALARAFPRFADDLAWWTEAARNQRARVSPPF